jgi:hypothetical protein
VDESFTYDNGTVHYSLILTNQNISGANAATVDVTFNPPGPTGAAGAYGAPVTLDTAVNIPVGTTITYNWDGSGGALARSALAVDLGAIPLDSGATVAYALAGFNGQYNATPAYDAIDSRNVPVAVIHPSTITTISASAASVEVGGTVDLTVTEENDGDVDLTDPQVVVNDGTSDIATLVAPPTSGDDGDGVLEVGETWTWNATTVAALNDVVINATTTFTATGSGTDSLDNVITYPGDPDERDAVTVDVEVVGNEGCTPGYWKNSPDCWECYTTGTKFSAVFGRQIKIFTGGNPKQSSNYITDPTLLQALGANGGGINALARDAVAALLNACDEDINYPLSVAGVIAAVQAAIDGGAATIESEHLLLDLYNNYGCPQDAHCNPIIPEEDLI